MEKYREYWWSVVCVSLVNGRKEIFYEFCGKKKPENWRKNCVKKHSRGIMFVAGISAYGLTAIRSIPPDAKVNAKFFIDKVLKPFSPVCLGRMPILPCGTTTAPDRTRPTGQWLEKFRLRFFFLHGIGPLTLLICRPWIIRWIEFSSADFGSERHWNGPCAMSGQKCLLISVSKRFLPGNPVRNLCFRAMAFRLNPWSHFLIYFVGWKKKRNKVGNKDVAHSLFFFFFSKKNSSKGKC